MFPKTGCRACRGKFRFRDVESSAAGARHLACRFSFHYSVASRKFSALVSCDYVSVVSACTTRATSRSFHFPRSFSLVRNSAQSPTSYTRLPQDAEFPRTKYRRGPLQINGRTTRVPRYHSYARRIQLTLFKESFAASTRQFLDSPSGISTINNDVTR